jgi:lipoprotein-anchoring transpeptidase ErfK/SrfK
MSPKIIYLALLALTLAPACEIRRRDAQTPAAPAPDSLAAGDTASAFGEEVQLTSLELEQGRLDEAWKQYVPVDSTAAQTVPAAALAEKWEDISPARVNGDSMQLPLSGRVAGPSVLRAQILLDRARFSPGVMDGKWGKNTEKAVYWLQRREGLPATGQIDDATYRRLQALAGSPDSLVVAYPLAAEDVAGPFEKLPTDIYERAKLKSSGYESLAEKLSERFHASAALLARLNPEADLDSLAAGDTLHVPALAAVPDSAAGAVAQLVVSEGGHFLHALDATGRILYHFPSSLGSRYDPSPSGDYEVVSVARNPWWHYQPKLLAHVPDTAREARIPPGPNNAVGSVWISLSKPHFGIHGTSAPESIGYTSSAGCVRLTNWDATFLAGLVRPGIPVQFRDVVEDDGAAADSTGTAARDSVAGASAAR